MDFELTSVQRAWQEKGTALGREIAHDATASDVVMGAARVGLLDAGIDLLAVAVAIEALAAESPVAATALALHTAGALSVTSDAHADALFRGDAVAALTLATDEVPVEHDHTLTGRASWVAPIAHNGIAVIGARREGTLVACVVELDDASVTVEQVPTAALRGLVCGHLTLRDARSHAVGPTLPAMARARILIAAVGLGIGRRAVRESLGTIRGSRGAGGEQNVQGLVADAATDLEPSWRRSWPRSARWSARHRLSVPRAFAPGTSSSGLRRMCVRSSSSPGGRKRCVRR
jgi:alkylation response protein AidB-like acyl-CoA dehydrogenase